MNNIEVEVEDPIIMLLFCISIAILWTLLALFLSRERKKKGLFAVTHNTIIDEKIMDKFFKACGLPVVHSIGQYGKTRQYNKIWHLKDFVQIGKYNRVTHIFSTRDIEGHWKGDGGLDQGFILNTEGRDIFIGKEKVIAGIRNRDLESEFVN